MALIHKIESLGQAVEQGLLTNEQAAHELQQYSDGGLTRTGAASVLRSWKTARSEYKKAPRQADEILRR